MQSVWAMAAKISCNLLPKSFTGGARNLFFAEQLTDLN